MSNPVASVLPKTGFEYFLLNIFTRKNSKKSFFRVFWPSFIFGLTVLIFFPSGFVRVRDFTTRPLHHKNLNPRNAQKSIERVQTVISFAGTASTAFVEQCAETNSLRLTWINTIQLFLGGTGARAAALMASPFSGIWLYQKSSKNPGIWLNKNWAKTQGFNLTKTQTKQPELTSPKTKTQGYDLS